ncbi:MAG: alginate export family protein [Pseudomonadota bacterium]
MAVSPAMELHAEQPGIVDAITGGTPGGMARYRYEFVDDEGFDENANASTLLLRLKYKTAPYAGLSGFVEFDYVGELFVNDFNSGSGTSSPDRDRFPVVADPKGPDLNQLFLSYAPSEHWNFRVGRRVLNLDDWRFVGGVVWRQNEQAYDGVELNFSGIENTRVFYSYVNRVRRIFGTTVPAGSHRQDTHLLNVKHTVSENLSLVGFAYLIDNEDEPAFSTRTYGLRAQGGLDMGGGRMSLLGEIAFQSSAYNAPVDFDANFVQLQAIWSRGAWSFGVGHELLGSDNGQGFRTPLATLHKFNGWADLFLTTPGAGLQDTYLRLDYNFDAWNLTVRYHDFRADAGSEKYGTELDAQATRKFGKHLALLLKGAHFTTDSTDFRDTSKLWVMLTASF